MIAGLPSASGRYVVSMRPAGLGDRLVCLGAAWVLARRTGRTLVADWRGGDYSADRQHNLFARCFAAPDRLAGVPFIGGDRVADLRLPTPRHPPRWNDDRTLAQPLGRPAADLFADRDAAVALIRSGDDRPEPVLVFDACVNDGLVSVADADAFYAALAPHARVAERLDRAMRRLPPPPWIGLHVRHGNGGEIGTHRPYWIDGNAALGRCRDAVAEARRRLGWPAPVIVATDSLPVARALLRSVPGSHRHPKSFRAPGAGSLHTGPGAPATLDEALVEMLLLMRSAILVRYPPGSFFSLPAAVRIAHRTGEAQTLDQLWHPWRRDGPLMPAIIGGAGAAATTDPV